jgi:hypothetical protein
MAKLIVLLALMTGPFKAIETCAFLPFPQSLICKHRS